MLDMFPIAGFFLCWRLSLFSPHWGARVPTLLWEL
jgi:hypothetical protein